MQSALVLESETSHRVTTMQQIQEMQIKQIIRVQIKQMVHKVKWKGKIQEQIRVMVHKVCQLPNATKIQAIRSPLLHIQE